MDAIAVNRAVVTRHAEAWSAGDLAAIRACHHPDFTLHCGGNNPLTGMHEGRDWAPAVLAGEKYGAIVARERFERDGEVAELERLLVHAVRDGQLHHCRIHDADQALVDRYLRAPRDPAGRFCPSLGHRSCATSASAPFSIPVLAASSDPRLAPIFIELGYCLVA